MRHSIRRLAGYSLCQKASHLLPVLAGLALLASSAQAIPAYSKKYGMDCSSCHWGATNRLNKFGRDFLWRGERTPDAEPISDDKGLNMFHYLSILHKFRYESDKDASPKTKFDVEALSFYSGGPLYENFSYFFEYYAHERGKETTSTGGSGDTAVREKLAEAYLFYNSAPDKDTFWFARAGQWTPRIIHTASTGGRIPISRPLVLNDNAGGGNLFTPRDRFVGLTAGFVNGGKVRGEFGLTNGGGGNARPNQPENNNAKDLFGSVEFLLNSEGDSVGLFGYSGKYPNSSTFEDEFTRYGILGAVDREKFSFSGAYFVGRNHNPPPTTQGTTGGTRDPKGYYLEAAFNPSTKTTLYGRYDYTDWDLGTKTRGTAFGASFRLSKLGRMVIEATSTKSDGSDRRNALKFELNWGF